MAGIGFVLQKLTNKDDLLGVARAMGHSAIASTGPWLATVLSLALITLLFSEHYSSANLINFRVIVIYNFGFSLLFSGPIYMVITRYLADNIHLKNVTDTPSVMFESLVQLYLILIPIALFFYFGYFILDLPMRLSAAANLFLIAPIWVLAVYVTALKDFKSVSWSFFIGLTISVLCALYFKNDYGSVGLLNGYNIGLAYIVFALVAKVFAEYPYKLVRITQMRLFFRRYWELAACALFYNGGMWIDKWLMWYFAPEAIELESKMRMYPDYDSAMFLAYLTIVPSIALFMFSVETNFFLHYKKFYYDILEHKPLKRIRENHDEIIGSIISSARNFLIVQGTFSLVVILTAAQLFAFFNINYLQIGIFRIGVLGAFFQVLMLHIFIILSYFDCRRANMIIQLVFLISNILFTMASIRMGFPYYGFGFFLASLLAFVISAIALFKHIQRLPYHAFITNNNSLRKMWKKKDDYKPDPFLPRA
jgi:uncharacterized membrane protein